MKRIFSKSILHWPLPVHIYHHSTVPTSYYKGCYIYTIKKRYPTFCIQTRYPLCPLEYNTPFYCYYEYYMSPQSNFGNNEKIDITPDRSIYIPKLADEGDIIVVAHPDVEKRCIMNEYHASEEGLNTMRA